MKPEQSNPGTACPYDDVMNPHSPPHTYGNPTYLTPHWTICAWSGVSTGSSMSWYCSINDGTFHEGCVTAR